MPYWICLSNFNFCVLLLLLQVNYKKDVAYTLKKRTYFVVLEKKSLWKLNFYIQFVIKTRLLQPIFCMFSSVVSRVKKKREQNIFAGWKNWLNIEQVFFFFKLKYSGASLVAQTIKNLPTMQETQVWSLSWEDPLEKGMATHSSILIWEIPRTEEHSGLQSMGSQRVEHDWVTNTFSFIVVLQCCVNFCCTAKWFSYTYAYILLKYSFPLWVITGYWIQFLVFHSRTVLFVHSANGQTKFVSPQTKFTSANPKLP